MPFQYIDKGRLNVGSNHFFIGKGRLKVGSSELRTMKWNDLLVGKVSAR